jgi:two-component system, response regulator PdtaR
MTGKRVLIAEDESTIRANLRKTLEHLGYLVIGEAGDGMSAILLTRQLRPDVVLVDRDMPRMDGIEVARLLQNEGLAPVILITNSSDRELVSRARDAGVLGFLVKPIHESTLMPIIEVACARWQEQHARKQELSQLQERLETRKVIERAKGYLMDSQGLREAEAFRRIQQLAMNSRKSMKEVAQAILLAQQITPDY